MPVQDTIGCFAQVERSKAAVEAALESEESIWLLFLESHEESPESRVLTVPRLGKFGPMLKCMDESMREGLLTVLHASWLNSDDARSLERLRDGNDLYRSLRPRLEKSDTVQLVVGSPTREGVISVRKHALQSEWPLADIELPVSKKFVSGHSGSVLREKGLPGSVDDAALDELSYFRRKRERLVFRETEV